MDEQTEETNTTPEVVAEETVETTEPTEEETVEEMPAEVAPEA